jgi:hypothetical protein
MEIIILMAWSIWTTRNDWIFNNIDPSVENCKQKFISEFSLMMHKFGLIKLLDCWCGCILF